MIANLKPYPNMKPSDVEWLGEVPVHWEVRKLKHWLTVNRQTLLEDTDPDYIFDYVDISSVGTGRLVTKPERLQFRDCPSRARRIVQSGDTIMSTVRTYLKAVWHADEVKSDLVASTGFAVLTPKPFTYAKFVSYLCLSEHFTNRVTANSVGIAYPAIAETKLETFNVGVPPLSEQTAIARFLDHATDQIERCIRAKEKLIALLEEQKQVMIHDAVTGRIDVRTGKPYPAYKPSGIEWLKNVPQHWNLRPAKWYFREVDERSQTGSEELLSVSHITGVTPRKEKNVTMFKAESNVGYKLCKPGDLVINTMWAWMAALGVSGHTGIVSPSYAVYRPLTSSELSGDFGNLILRTTTYKNEYICRSTGIRPSRLRLYPEEFLRIRLLCPPQEEQEAIVNYICSESQKTKLVIASTESEIALLREYHTRLIADVVTGKLDVREAAANLPELETITDGGGEKIPAESDSRQSGARLHNEALPTAPRAGS